jgi:peptidoglycan/xylan/chitin deacetylase (PgdA/CDA1 family)
MTGKGSGALTILTYHSLDTSGSVVSVAPDAFADQISCLADLGFRGIALREAVAHRAATGSWPAQAVVVTFDDGYANFYDVAWPVLMRHGFTATLFLVTRHVGGVNDWAPPPSGLGARAMLSWQQAAELSASDVEIAAHTQTHPNLLQLSPAAVADEIVASRGDIETRLEQPVESFAYPFGRVSAAAEKIVQREFRAACTTVLRRARDDGLARLPRIDAYYLRSVDTLRRLLKGQLDGTLRLRRWGRWAREAIVGVG